MGQENTKLFQENRVPREKLFKLSYIVHKNVKENAETKSLNLTTLLEPFKNVDIIMQFLYCRLNSSGYNLKPLNIELSCRNVNEIFDEINVKGFPIKNNTLIKDIEIIKNCYRPTLNNIYHFLNRGNILLGFIILDETFVNETLNLKNFKTIATDLVLIVGYSPESILIKTKWVDETLKIDNKFINNIRELWDITVKCFNEN